MIETNHIQGSATLSKQSKKAEILAALPIPRNWVSLYFPATTLLSLALLRVLSSDDSFVSFGTLSFGILGMWLLVFLHKIRLLKAFLKNSQYKTN